MRRIFLYACFVLNAFSFDRLPQAIDDNIYDSKLKALKDGGFNMNFILNSFQKRQSSKIDKKLLFLNWKPSCKIIWKLFLEWKPCCLTFQGFSLIENHVVWWFQLFSLNENPCCMTISRLFLNWKPRCMIIWRLFLNWKPCYMMISTLFLNWKPSCLTFQVFSVIENRVAWLFKSFP